MTKLGFCLSVVLLLLLVLTPGAGAQGPAGSQSVSAWTGEYFNNVSLNGSPVTVRDDANIDFFWREWTSPVPGQVNVNNYSVRWTRSVNFPNAGKWTFHFVADDGVRVWVDNNMVIDAWYDQAPTPHTGTVDVTAGWHTVRIEYYNKTLGGTAKFSYWGDVSYSDWKAEYFANQTLAGAPLFIRNDPNIDFNWGAGSPEVRIPADHFSVRWTRTMRLSTGKWRFTTTTDDGVRVWVNNHLLIDKWVDQATTTHSAEIDLNLMSNAYTIKMEYYENAGGATAKLALSLITPPGEVWRGQYYNNVSLSGTPSFVRDDPEINFHWGFGSPGAPIPPDDFSVRWETRKQFPGGNHVFSITSDDGARVWVDGVLLIDAWYDRPPTTSSAARSLAPGMHDVRVEYYERGGNASVVLKIAMEAPPPVITPPAEVWRGQYFNNLSLSGTPSFVRNDSEINFQWGMGSPGAPIPVDNFSVRWETRKQFPGGNHVFSITSDDGARVWVDGQLLIDAWYDRPPTTSSAGKSLAPGPHDIRVEYYERGGNASVVLKIGMEAPPPVGEVVVDDRSAGWTMGGPSSYWHNATNGIGGQSLWTFNNSMTTPYHNWARWSPTLRHAGNYEVFAYIPRGVGTTLNARYWIFHGQKYDMVARNQALFADQWMSLGTYNFDALGGENVLLSDVTYECYVCRTLVFDAVKFVPR